MSIAFVNGVSDDDVASLTAVTLGWTTVGGNNLIVFADRTNGHGTSMNSITDTQGNTYTKIADVNINSGGGSTDEITVWLATGIVGGAGNIVTFHGTGTNFLAYTIAEYSSSSPLAFDQVATGGNEPVSSITTGTVTTTVAAEILIAFCRSNGGTLVAGTSYTIQNQNAHSTNLNYGIALEDQSVSSTGTYDASISKASGSGNMALILVTLSEGGSPPPPSSSQSVFIIL